MPPIINILALGNFAAALTFRCLDPVLPQIAADTGVDVHAAASLLTAFALPYALIQPTLGAAGDLFGKTRIISFCLVLLVISCGLGAAATSFEMLFVSRVAMGAAAGGVFPLTLALTGDLVPVAQRQHAVARLLATTVTGTLIGSVLAGFIADAWHWRGVLIAMTVAVALVTVVIMLSLRRQKIPAAEPLSLRGLIDGYREILRNPQTAVVYVAVFLEGLCVNGLFPFVAVILAARGESRAAIAGLVLAGFAFGGLAYSISIKAVLRRLSANRLMLVSGAGLGITLALAGLNPNWAVQFVIFFAMGITFYGVHGTLQIFGSELAPQARGSAIALFATAFFLGQAVGPPIYGPAMTGLGIFPTLAVSGLVMFLVAVLAAVRLRHKEAA